MKHAFLTAVAVVCWPALLGAVEATLTDDISIPVDQVRPAKGAHPVLNLGDELVYLKFDLASVLPEGVTSAHVAKATLRLYVNKVHRPGACKATILQQNWTEARRFFPATQQSRPAIGNIHSNVAVQQQAGKFLVLDVTEIVRAWQDGTPNCGLVVEGATLGVFAVLPGPGDPPQIGPALPLVARFDSKENTATGHVPALQVVLQNAPSAP
jgi:hypothetical protein